MNGSTQFTSFPESQLTSFPLCQKSQDIEEKSTCIKRRHVVFRQYAQHTAPNNGTGIVKVAERSLEDVNLGKGFVSRIGDVSAQKMKWRSTRS